MGTEHHSGTQARVSVVWAGHDAQTRAGSSRCCPWPWPPRSHPRRRCCAPPTPLRRAHLLPPPRGPSRPPPAPLPGDLCHPPPPAPPDTAPAGTPVPMPCPDCPPRTAWHASPPQLTPSIPRGSAPLSPSPCCSATAAQPALGTPVLLPAPQRAAAARWHSRHQAAAAVAAHWRGGQEVSETTGSPGRAEMQRQRWGGHDHPRGHPPAQPRHRSRHPCAAGPRLGCPWALPAAWPSPERRGAAAALPSIQSSTAISGGLRPPQRPPAALPAPSHGGWQGGGAGTAVTPAGQRDPCPGGGCRGGTCWGQGGCWAPAFVLGWWGLRHGRTQSRIVRRGEARGCSCGLPWPLRRTPLLSAPASPSAPNLPGTHPPSWGYPAWALAGTLLCQGSGSVTVPSWAGSAQPVTLSHDHCLSLAGSGSWVGIAPRPGDAS